MAEPIGVAQVVHSLEIGGMERVALNLALGLPREKWRSLIVCLTVEGEFAELAREQGVDVIALGKQPGVDLRLPGRLARLLRDEGIRLVHGHNSGPWFTGTLAARRLGLPMVVTDHSRPYPEKPRIQKIERFLSRWARIVSVSAHNKQDMVKFLRIPADKIDVIPNGVQPVAPVSADRRAALRDELGLAEDDTVFLSVARLERQKGFDVLLEAVRIAKHQGITSKFVVVGFGSEGSFLASQIREYDLTDTVILAGKRMNVGQFYGMADAFFLASRWEGLPMALLEAMSAGLPVVSTGVGDIPAAVTDGTEALLVPSEDPAALAAAFASLASAEARERREAMGSAGRARFDAEYSMDVMVRRYAELYEELI